MKKILLTALICLSSMTGSIAQEISKKPLNLKIIVSKHSTEYKYNPWDRIEKSTLEHFTINDYEKGGIAQKGQNHTYTSAVNSIELLGTKAQEVVRSDIFDGITIVYDKNEAKILMNYDVQFLSMKDSLIAQNPPHKTLFYILPLVPTPKLTQAYSDKAWTIYYSLE